jgi:hypothetical protein
MEGSYDPEADWNDCRGYIERWAQLLQKELLPAGIR